MRAYRLLLHLLPRSFRREYGREMEAIFERRLLEASGAARLALWVGASAEIARSAVLVHADLSLQDLRQAGRSLARSRGFAVTAVIVTALGIGATTAVFSVADYVLLRPLPFPEPDRLVKVWQDQSSKGYSRMELSPGNFRDWKAGASGAFESLAAYAGISQNLTGGAAPERLDGTRATTDLFRTLGVTAISGRTFLATDEGGPAVVVISTSLRERLFGDDADVVGRTIVLDRLPHVIVGVMPPTFHFPDRSTEFWTVLAFEPGDYADRANRFLRSVGRLAPGVSLEQAKARLDTIAARLERAFPVANAATGATVVRLRDEVTPTSQNTVIALAGAAIVLLLITCLNLTNLLLARGVRRRRELSVRVALGAGADRLVREHLAESTIVAALGAILGVGLAAAAVPLVARLVPTSLPVADAPSLDGRMLALAALVTVMTALGFGLLPALRSTRVIAGDALRAGPRAGHEPGAERVRSVLVVTEVAASVVLLVVTALMLHALRRVEDIDPGFRPDGVLTMRTALPVPAYLTEASKQQFYDRVLGQVRALPGVQAAAYTSFLPMVMRGGVWPVAPEGQPDDPATSPSASLRLLTPGFFSTLGTPILQGRDFRPSDSRASPPDGDDQARLPVDAIVSASFVRDVLGGGAALGKRFRMEFMDATIIGVVGDIKVRGLERVSEPQVYLPSSQVPDGALPFYAPKDLVVRVTGDPLALAPHVRRIIAETDPLQPVSDVRTLADVVERETGVRRTQLGVLGLFAAVAALLAAVGIHGLLAYVVSSRTRELGVRMALGASPGVVVRLVLGRGLALASMGVAIGVVAARGAGQALQALLAGVSPADPSALFSAATLSMAMTLVGCAWPAVRAVRIDPAEATRVE